jgi:hypothetical protein
MSTKLQLFNMAISKVSGTRMVTLTDTHAEAVILNDEWLIVLADVYSDVDWSFARRLAKVNKVADPSLLDRSMYPAPPTFLHIWAVGEDQYIDSDSRLEWYAEDQLLHVPDGGDSVYVRGTQLVSEVDPLGLPPRFELTYVTKLATRLALPITENQNLFDSLMSEYDLMITNARSIDGLQGTNRKLRKGNLVRARNA